jgi:hypothetical protein
MTDLQQCQNNLFQNNCKWHSGASFFVGSSDLVRLRAGTVLQRFHRPGQDPSVGTSYLPPKDLQGAKMGAVRSCPEGKRHEEDRCHFAVVAGCGVWGVGRANQRRKLLSLAPA